MQTTTTKYQPGVTIVSLEESAVGNVHARPRSGLEIDRLLQIRSWTFSTLRYFLFLLVFSIVVFLSRDGETSFYYTDQLRNLFLVDEIPPELSFFSKNFWGVSKHEEIFQWLLGPFLENMYKTTLYNGAPVPEAQLRRIMGYDKVVGLVRLRQLRVQPFKCSVSERFRGQIKECYAPYSSDSADRRPFGPNGTYTFGSDSEKVFAGYNGLLQVYPDNGYFVDLPKDYNATRAVLLDLMNNYWIDLYTRMVAVEFTVYNANLDLFCVIRIAFELPHGGGVLPNASFRTVNLLRYIGGTQDMFEIVAECILALFVVAYIIEEGVEMVQACRGYDSHGRRIAESGGWRMYFIDDVWNYLDMLNYALFIVVAVFRVISLVTLGAVFSGQAFQTDSRYVNFQGVALLQSQELNINAFNMLLCWIKTLKYLSRIDRVNHLSKTLARSASDIAIFLVIFLIFFFAYAQAGWMMFAVDVKGFRTVARSAESLILSIFGAFSYSELEASNRYLAPLYFFSYMLMTSFILLNVFIAIITNAYDSVREHAARKDAQDRVSALLTGKVEHLTFFAQIQRSMVIMRDAMFVNRIRKRQALLDRLNRDKFQGDTDGDGVLSREEARAALKYDDDGERLEAFDAIDTNDDNLIDHDELRTTLQGLYEEKGLIEEALSDFIVLEKSLASEGKKLSPEQVEQREELSKQLDDYKRRVAHLGKLAPADLKELQIRSPTDGVDAALLSQLHSTTGDGHAELVQVLAALQTTVNAGFSGINSRMRSLATRLKRLEDDARAARHRETRDAAGVGVGMPCPIADSVGRSQMSAAAAAASAGGRLGTRPVFDMSSRSTNAVAPAP